MFEWLEINLLRFTQVGVIAGIVCMIVGIVFMLSGEKIVGAIFDMKHKKKKKNIAKITSSETVVTDNSKSDKEVVTDNSKSDKAVVTDNSKSDKAVVTDNSKSDKEVVTDNSKSDKEKVDGEEVNIDRRINFEAKQKENTRKAQWTLAVKLASMLITLTGCMIAIITA